MWRLKPSVGSVLYFTLRYPMLFNTIAVIYAYVPRHGQQSQLVSSEGVDIRPVPDCVLTARLLEVGTSYALISELVMRADNRDFVWHDSCSVIMRLEMAGDALILLSSAGAYYFFLCSATSTLNVNPSSIHFNTAIRHIGLDGEQVALYLHTTTRLGLSSIDNSTPLIPWSDGKCTY